MVDGISNLVSQLQGDWMKKSRAILHVTSGNDDAAVFQKIYINQTFNLGNDFSVNHKSAFHAEASKK